MEMTMSLNEIIEKKIQYEMGQLYNYLNDIENTHITPQLTGQNLVSFYHLREANHQYGHWRCICPFHSGASNRSEFIFNDDEKTFICFACDTKGTYLKFIALMQGYTANALNEAKIFAAIHFGNMNLGFDSINDYKEQIKQKIIKRYETTKSLKLNDYYDISILPYHSKVPNNKKVKKSTNSQKHEKNAKDSSTETHPTKSIEINPYLKAIEDAKNSILLHEILQNRDKFNSADKLKDFMERKYFLHRDIIEKYGLIYFAREKQKELTYPNFYGLNDRVLFPIKDHKSGDIIGFQGRYVFYSKEGKSASWGKYSNILDYGELKTKDNGYQYYIVHPFPIGQFLFNLYEIKNENPTKIWITEGIADCLKLISLGFTNAVSPGQSNLTDEQIALLKEYFGLDIEILLFFDNDDNKVGQNNSISKSYKLWDSGFRKIKIIRTFQGQGTDITDVAAKIRNDDQLKMMIDLWEKSAFEFAPAKKEDLDFLFQSGFYTEADIYSLDPRNIKNEIAKVNLLKKIDTHANMDKKVLKFIKGISTINELAVNGIKSALNSSIKEQGTEEPASSSRDEVEVEKKSSSQSTDYVFTNITDAQLYRLKQRFDIPTIQKIDENCTKKQITAIVGNIINNIDFDLGDYLAPKKYKVTTLIDKDFNPVLEEPEEMPF